MSRYQEKHSPTHHPDYRPIFNLYQLLPSTTIHSILHVQIMCLAIFFHNLSPCPLWSTSWYGALTSYSIHFFTQSVSSFRNTCPYHCNLFCSSIKIISIIPSLSLTTWNSIFYLNITYPSDHSHICSLSATSFSFLTGQGCCCCSFGQGSILLWTHTLRPFYSRPIALTQEGRSLVI